MKAVKYSVLALFIIGFGVVAYILFKEHTTQKVLLDKLQKDLEKGYASVVPAQTLHPLASGAFEWGQVHSMVRNTVVQVFVHSAQYNWLEPYKTPQQRVSSGTGFFINDAGLLITNAHVVDQYRAVYIQIPYFGKRRFDVEVIGVSPERDLALLQVIPEDFAIIKAELGDVPHLEFGDSDEIHRADEVMTLGYPLGQQSLKSTVGVVSGRQHIDGRSMIQIDAPINPGNSGGPSLNRSGKVIGVNTAGITEGGAQNVGYIIPSSEVQLFLKQLEDIPAEHGVKFLRKPFLGILFGNGSDALADFLHNPKPGGFYVVEVYPGSPLDKASVKAGDMIYEIDGHKIDYFGDIKVAWSEDKVSVVDYVARLMPGEKMHLVIYRNGVRKEMTAQFDFSDMTPVRNRYPGYEIIDYEVVGGMVVMELTLNHVALLLQKNAQLVKYAELESQMKPALIITHVLPDSEASKTRSLHEAMIIKEINGKPVSTLEEFRKQVAKSIDTGFLTVKADGNVFTVLPFIRALRDEPKLAAAYFYNVTPFTQGLFKKMGTVHRS